MPIETRDKFLLFSALCLQSYRIIGFKYLHDYLE